MSTISKYIVIASRQASSDEPEYDSYREARAEAESIKGCVLERTYEYSDEELVDDFTGIPEGEEDGEEEDE